MFLQAQGIDDDSGGVGRVRRFRGLSDEDRDVGRGRGIYDASEGLETTMEAVGDRQRSLVIYDKYNYRGVGRGR